ncbi:hypothetical protein [Rhodopirellula halodulae]|uniref:hypothetical protein n=1 Tax=Rhodopirellula halodulae TaxID=2894198 RepID=UPI001E2A6288|nr:hypothetical protein [Rhodopirellula sp. JC737]MCC9656741.1 hypothetical protein [Rhodopirellula sp. JC737]
MSSIQAVFVAIPLVSGLIQQARGSAHEDAILLSAVNGFQLATSVLICIGGAQMGHFKSYTLARLGAILSCIPIITPLVFVGIPFGIWALRLLALPEIRQQFEVRKQAV